VGVGHIDEYLEGIAPTCYNNSLGVTRKNTGEYIVKIEDNNSMRREQQWEANWVAHNE
jgi:hypothetical protein